MRRGVVLLGFAAALAAGSVTAGSVTPQQLSERLAHPDRTPFLLDVRTREEFAGGHVPGAVNIPVAELAQRLDEIPREQEIVVYCERGGRASRAAGLLAEKGFREVDELRGSMAAWRAGGHPVSR